MKVRFSQEPVLQDHGIAMKICEGHSQLSSMDPVAIKEDFKRSGILLFRGFDVDPEKFEAFTSQFSEQRMLSLGSEKSAEPGGYLQIVAPHGYAQGLHQENGSTVFRPELLWFYCHTPACAAGQTTYADGTRVWELLQESTRKLFLENKLKYSHETKREDWLTSEGYLDVHSHVGRLRMAGVSVRFDENEVMYNEYVASAVTTTRWGGAPAFVNSLRAPYSCPITFANDTPVPEEIIEEIDVLHEQLTQEIQWQAGDFVLIDNTRYLHGRRAFEDQNRRVYTTMSLANF